jgi:hypothetical protein
MYTNKVCCLIKVLDWFVMISKFAVFFKASYERVCGTVGGCFTTRSTATEPHRLHKDD